MAREAKTDKITEEVHRMRPFIDIDAVEIAVARLVIARSEFLAPFKAVIKCFWAP